MIEIPPCGLAARGTPQAEVVAGDGENARRPAQFSLFKDS